MRVGYTIFPRNEYVAETLRGIVTFQDLLRLTERQRLDRRIQSHYHTVSDYSRATLRLSEHEVHLYCNTLCALTNGRNKRALVIVGARNLAFAGLLQSLLIRYGDALRSLARTGDQVETVARCFYDREAAVRWVAGQRLSDCQSESVPADLNIAPFGFSGQPTISAQT